MYPMYVGIVNGTLVCIDARTLVDHARIEAQNHRFTYNEVTTPFLRQTLF